MVFNNIYNMNHFSTLFVYTIILFIIIHSIYPFYFSHIFNIFFNKGSNESLDVIIAHYNEDLDWVDKILPENCRIYIYTKSDQKPICKRSYIHEYLPNVGREGHTYLHHILKYYDHEKSDNILFLPGTSNVWYKNIILNAQLSQIGKYDFCGHLIQINDFTKICDEMCIDFIKQHGYYSIYKNPGDLHHYLTNTDYSSMEIFNKKFQIQPHYYSQWGMNLIKSKLIHNRSKMYYEDLYNVMNKEKNSLEGHFLERAWYSIFTQD